MQGIPVVLWVSVYKNLLAVFRNGKKDARFLRLGKYRHLFAGMNGFCRCLGMAAVRCIKYIIKSAHQRNFTVCHPVWVNAEKLLGKLSFLNAVIMVKSSLCAPADMQGGGHMLLRPVHNVTDFLPVIHFFKGNVLHRRPGNNQTVKLSVPDFIYGSVKLIEMICRCV